MQDRESTTIRRTVINQAISYIFDHIEEDITVDDVARHCAYSKYHLTRIFKEETDEALYQFMKRVRLERSAWGMKVEKEKSIPEKGGELLVKVSSFSHGFSLDALEDAEEQITIEHLEPFTVVYERKKGNYHDLKKEWCAFIEKYQYFATKDTVYIECTIDDPSITDEDHCMYELCQTISPDDPALLENPELLTHDSAGGTYAVYHFKGYPQFLFLVYQEIFCRWLSKTGNQLDERPIFDIYREVRADGYMEIDICFPLKKK